MKFLRLIPNDLRACMISVLHRNDTARSCDTVGMHFYSLVMSIQRIVFLGQTLSFLFYSDAHAAGTVMINSKRDTSHSNNLDLVQLLPVLLDPSHRHQYR